MTRAPRCALALVIVLAAWANGQAREASTGSGIGHAGLAGFVHDSLGHPIRLANVFVDGSSVSSVSDDSGHFYLRGLAPGKNGFTITKIGYAPVSFETTLLADSMVVLSIRMRAARVLDTVKVSAAKVNAYLQRTGFIERRRAGLGTFLSPEKIDSIAPGLAQPSDFLKGVPGIDLRCGVVCSVHTHFPPDCLWLFVDGVPHGFVYPMIDSVGITPGVIAAIEVYDRPVIVPAEFQGSMPVKQGRGFTTAAGCGAVAIWTRSRIP
jgi:hypothetical protein